MTDLLFVFILYFTSNVFLHLVCQLGLLNKPEFFIEKVVFVFGCLVLTTIFWMLYAYLPHVLVVLKVIFLIILTLFLTYWLTLKLSVGIVTLLNKFKS